MPNITSRDRVLAALNHKKADRVAIHDSPWLTTINRWHQEGLPEDQSPEQYFSFEFSGFEYDGSFQFADEIIEETDEYIIRRNADAAVRKDWKTKTSTPAYEDFTIVDRNSWERYKSQLTWNDTRVDWAQDLLRHKAEREEGQFVHFSAAVGYDRTQGICGSERLLMAMLDDPNWVRDMFSQVAQLAIDALEEMLSRGFEFDAVWLFDDMGYRNAALFSPRAYREISFPYHKKLCDFIHNKGLKVILHSCGNVMELVPQLIEAGFDCLQPLESKAGMDIFKLKKTYGDVLAFMGGIDVRKMADPNPCAIEKEIKTKFEVAMADGAYIYHSDHSVPDNVSFEQYKRVIELVHKYGKFE